MFEITKIDIILSNSEKLLSNKKNSLNTKYEVKNKKNIVSE